MEQRGTGCRDLMAALVSVQKLCKMDKLSCAEPTRYFYCTVVHCVSI